MKEKLTSRVGRIISGSVNALVDAVENKAPAIVMEEAIKEIDDAIDDVRSELGKVVATKHLANKRLMESNRKHEDLSEKAELAIKENREDLAETALSQQLDIEAQIPILESQINDLSSQEKELESFIAALQAKKREMRDELRIFRESKKEADATRSVSAGNGNTKASSVESRVSRAESAFDRVIEKATGLAGTSGITDHKTASQMAELEEMSRNNRVQERLAALKGKIGKE